MKIAIVCYPTFGGSGVVATELGLELARRGHEIHFITYSLTRSFGIVESKCSLSRSQRSRISLVSFSAV